MSETQSPPIAVVAGGGSGIGRGAALRLAQQGYQLVLVGRTAEKLAAVADEIHAAGGQAECFVGDVHDWQKMAELGESLAAKGVDVLVNSAGGQSAQPSAEMSQENWEQVIGINLNGAFYLLRHLYPALKKRQGAVVTIVANMWQLPTPTMAHSAASRAGVVNLTRTLAKEWAPDRIRLNAVAPGLTDSGALLPQFKAMVERVPLGRIGEVDDVVDAVMFLAHASYITGEVLSVDGGIRFGV
ncbi:SDR family NAD(P)-dependent oxidoreductase [Halioxenophilus sp. WMMB6]|uniref:SDR family NAD(P)-dependent oxidoreductase n=1 Tax=Halioxenophilus sp. WMMB6 TaxID=3073815 RepID=UPI00295ECDC6|nr:SDR family NAD(P)-dependent oxidoreductase [Halioxenophilus sp. WMMB6]